MTPTPLRLVLPRTPTPTLWRDMPPAHLPHDEPLSRKLLAFLNTCSARCFRCTLGVFQPVLILLCTGLVTGHHLQLLHLAHNAYWRGRRGRRGHPAWPVLSGHVLRLPRR
eukprot:gnl/Ergobibamus_cyprinoides/4196.p1 GENE.gnl/Ergobibamus_cyprinoides/4196~~gnl/Ergobibamus_cyprinoides/4196.p1  ORF type:complete len:110 (+),score=11.18 gnl/Ergobibamus_cyprinoides/4196:90-419(+)